MLHRALLALAVLGACSTAEEQAVLEIQRVAAPDDTCNVDVASQVYLSSGLYDPSRIPGTISLGFDASLRLRNNIARATDDTAVTFGNREVRQRTNTISLLGYDVCWYRGDDSRVSEIGSNSNGPPIDCDDLPADQKRFIPSSGQLDEGGGELINTISILTSEDLRAAGIFGSGFNPNNISFSDDPTATNRDTDWGTYPSTATIDVIVRMRAVGKVASGSSTQSGWFDFPITLCPTCIRDSCAWQCVGAVTGVPGTVLDPTLCLPFQGESSVSCVALAQCIP